MNEEKIKELLSEGFLTLIGHRNGYQCSRPPADYGVDLTVSRIGAIERGGKTRFLQTADSIDFQLKCTTLHGVEFVENGIKYDLSVKNYNDLVQRRNDSPPLYLFLCVLPHEPEVWLRRGDDLNNLILGGKGYWYLPAVGAAESQNEATFRIEIPNEQQVDIGFLEEVFTAVYG
jgi:hypothetical protein